MPHVRVISFNLDRSSRRDHSAFRDYDHAISNVIVFAIRILRFTVRRNYHPVPNVRVLVDNGTLNAAMGVAQQRRSPASRPLYWRGVHDWQYLPGSG